MTEDQFWTLIDQARGDGESSASPKRLHELLNALNSDDVSDFGFMFYEKVCDLNTWHLWGAGHVISNGMSGDSFHYFRSWIVGKGKEALLIAATEPDELAPYIDDLEVDNELLEYVAVNILEERGSDVDPRDRSHRRADDAPAGEPFDEDTVAGSFPKLSAFAG